MAYKIFISTLVITLSPLIVAAWILGNAYGLIVGTFLHGVRFRG